MKLLFLLKELSPFLRALVLVFFYTPIYVYADFVMDFTPDNIGTMTDAVCSSDCSSTSHGYTPVLISGSHSEIGEDVIDPITGVLYKHFIVGSLEEGFIQEVYIQQSGGIRCVAQTCWETLATKGDYGLYGNYTDPLSSDASFTGNASANPMKVIVTQLINGDGMAQLYQKKKFDRKALISQQLTVPGDIIVRFEIDMSEIPINAIAISGEMTVNQVDLPGTEFDFDVNEVTGEGVNRNVNAGQYIYLPGDGPLGSGGNYLYLDGGVDMNTITWSDFFDHTQDNPWREIANKPDF